MIKTIYLNIEDDVRSVVLRLKTTLASEVLLVIPKKSYLFADSINLRLLRKQTDLLGKKIYILTQDEMGMVYAREAGFGLKFFPSQSREVNKTIVSSSTQAPRPTMRDQMKPTQLVPKPTPEPIPPQIKKPQTPQPITPPPAARPPVSVPVSAPAPQPRPQFLSPQSPQSHQPLISIPSPGIKKPEVQLKSPSMFGLREKYEKTPIKVKRVEKRSESQPDRPKTKFRIFLALFLLVSAAAAVYLLFFVIPKATITLYPKYDAIDQEFEFNASAKIDGQTGEPLQVERFEETLIQSGSIDSTGKKEIGSKSSGMVKIFNYTGKPITLKAATTTLFVGSKKYVLNNDINALKAIPSTVKSEAANVTDAIPVTALVGGDDYNIPAGTRLEITNQSFGSKPEVLYAKVSTSFVGGNSRLISILTAQDLEKAKKDLMDKAIATLKQDYLEKDKVIMDGGFKTEQVEFGADKKEGDETTNSATRLKMKVTGLAAAKSQIVTLAREKIAARLDENSELQPADADTFVPSARNLDMLNLKVAVDITYKTRSRSKLSIDEFPAKLKGVSRTQAISELEADPALQKFEISLSPSWQSRMPFFPDKITVREVEE
ncbi:MAG TPA: hypothetical protein VEA59_00245 [Patescibacteria group bacterium]|nr:hypothetical protein [Patescibacteria group bacterium]